MLQRKIKTIGDEFEKTVILENELSESIFNIEHLWEKINQERLKRGFIPEKSYKDLELISIIAQNLSLKINNFLQEKVEDYLSCNYQLPN